MRGKKKLYRIAWIDQKKNRVETVCFLFRLALIIITSKQNGNYCESKIIWRESCFVSIATYIFFPRHFFSPSIWIYSFICASGEKTQYNVYLAAYDSIWRVQWRVVFNIFFSLWLTLYRAFLRNLMFFRVIIYDWSSWKSCCAHPKFVLALLIEAKKINSTKLWRMVNGKFKQFFVQAFGINTFHNIMSALAGKLVTSFARFVRFDLCIAWATRLKQAKIGTRWRNK